uniref:Coilin N-terminal domain-containing protein n=1 Tax=Glossina austeni TaxID=7395 RepID=A0A1A9UF78_GLOAU
MQRFGVKIDLSPFFDDERKLIFIMVESTWKFVEDLQNRVQTLFDVDVVRFTSSDDCFLHPKESIEIVKLCSSLKAFVPKECLEKRKSKHKKEKRHQDEAMQVASPELPAKEVKKKRKLDVLENASTSSPMTESKSNNSRKDPFDLGVAIKRQKVNKSSEISSTSETVPDGNNDTNKDRRANKKKIKILVKDSPQNQANQIEKETDFARSSKITNSTPFAKSTSIDSGPKLDGSPESKHIHFQDTDTAVSTTAEAKVGKRPTKVVFRCPLNGTRDILEKARIFPLPWALVKEPKNVIEIKENILLKPNNLTKEVIESAAQCLEKSPKICQGIETVTKNVTEKLIETTAHQEIQDNGEGKHSKQIPDEATDENMEEISNEKNETIEIKTTLETCSADDKKEDQTVENIVKVKKTDTTTALLGESTIDCIDLSADFDEEMGTTPLAESIKISGNDSGESDIEEISEIIDLNETNDENTSKQCLSLQPAAHNDISIAKILPFCIRLSDLPKPDDIIVFKVPYVNKGQKRSKTNYMAGKCEYISQRLKSIKILVVDGLSEFHHVPSKYHWVSDDSQTSSYRLQAKLSDLEDVKIYSKS